MARVIRVEGDISRNDGQDVSEVLFDKIVRKVVSLLERQGCTIRAEWELAQPEKIEDLLG